MSSILKALRRVEDEVAERAARDLREEVLAPARSVGRERSMGRRGLRVAGLAVGVLTLLALGVVLGRRLVPPPSASTPESVARTDAPPPPPAQAAPSATPSTSAATSGASAPPAAPTAAPAPTAPVVAVVAPPLPPPPSAFVDIDDEPLGATGAAPAPAPGADSARGSFREAPMPAPAAKSRPAPAPAKVAAAPARRPEPRPTPRPAARAPSASASAPRVASTVWHPDSDRRRAVVEVAGAAREVREGETVGAYLVLAIGPTGVVFRRDGNDVTRRVGQR